MTLLTDSSSDHSGISKTRSEETTGAGNLLCHVGGSRSHGRGEAHVEQSAGDWMTALFEIPRDGHANVNLEVDPAAR